MRSAILAISILFLILQESWSGAAPLKWQLAEGYRWAELNVTPGGKTGFTFEYSATFAQVAALSRDLHAEYAKSVFIDFGYARFWREGYGKDFCVVNTKDSIQEDLLGNAMTLAWQNTVKTRTAPNSKPRRPTRPTKRSLKR